jgi:thiol-disulfide isomerase/thioredoxin
MSRILGLFSFMIICSFGYSQNASNFTVTDYNNQLHNLYADYLDQDITVVVKVFFTTCPPCQIQSPFYQEKYEEWGSGAYDVAFFEISNQGFDSNQDCKDYSEDFGTTMFGVGADGGALDALDEYTSGTFGPFFGTPTYFVIAPDRTVIWDTGLAGLDQAIIDTGAEGPPMAPLPPSRYFLTFNDIEGNEISRQASTQILMKSNADAAYELDITSFINGGLFEYPTTDIPEIEEPFISIVDPTTNTPGVSALDLIVIQKHLLGIEPFNNAYRILASDVNNSGNASAIDLIELQKFILGTFSELPNNNLLNFYFPDCQNCQNLVLPLGTDMDFDIDIVRVVTGDVN